MAARPSKFSSQRRAALRGASSQPSKPPLQTIISPTSDRLTEGLAPNTPDDSGSSSAEKLANNTAGDSLNPEQDSNPTNNTDSNGVAKDDTLQDIADSENNGGGQESGVDADQDEREKLATIDPPETTHTYKNEGKKNKRRGLSRRSKILLSLFGSSGFVMILLIGALLFFFSSQKIVQLAENVTVYNMARSARTLRLAQSEILEENIASNTISESRIAALRTRFNDTRIGKAVTEFNKLRPEKVFKNLSRNLEPSYVTTGKKNIFGFDKKTFNGYNYTARDGTVTFIEKADNRFFRAGANSAERVRFANELNAVVDRDLQGVKSFVRTRAVKKLLAEKGITLRWWDKLGKEYNGLSKSAAAKQAQKQAREKIKPEPTTTCQSPTVCDAVKEVGSAETKALQEAVDDPNVKSAAGLVDDVSNKTANQLDSAVRSRGLVGALEFGSVIYGIALPLCLIYDGSIENAKSSIDNNELALQRTFFSASSAADQMKAGDINASAVGGFNDKIGDISDSISERRASGKVVDTASQVSPLELPQSNANGQFTLSDVALPPAAATALDTVLIPGCGFMTDLKTGIALTTAELIAALFTGSGSKIGATAAKEGVSLAFENLVKRLAFTETRRLIEERGIAAVLKRTGKKYVIKTGLQVGAVVALTQLAKMAVLKHVGAANNGLATDATFANQVDMGGKLYAQDSGRILGGRPLTTAEIEDSKQADLAYLKDVTSQKSVGERYFALSNPSSFVSRAGFSSYSFLTKKGSVAGNIINSISSVITSPTKLFNVNLFGQNSVVKAATVGSGDYNIVEWGWTTKELQTINNNPELFSPMINMLELETANKTEEIEKKYGRCLTDSSGSLLASEDPAIVRNEDGSVKPDSGLCSPNNLGIDNAEFGQYMVFRWRLSKRNDTVKQQLLDIQDPSENDGTETVAPVSPSSTPAPTTGPTTGGLTINGLNGYTVPCEGRRQNVARTGSGSPAANWNNVIVGYNNVNEPIHDSGEIGKNSAGQPIKVYIREPCDKTNVKNIVIVSSIHGSENGGQFVSHELLFNNEDLPRNVRIIAIPELNASAIAASRRKNANGVDLNRNFPTGWDSLRDKDETSPSSMFYKGPSAISEPETKAITSFLNSLGKTQLFLVYHDNVNYIGSTGTTSQSLAVKYAATTGQPRGNTNGVSTLVNQRGSLDYWYNTTTGSPSLLIEMSSDQSPGVIDKHVEAVKKLITDGSI